MEHGAAQSILYHRRLHRFREVVTGIFGLITVLGAFSLTELPIERTEDLGAVLCYFAPLFFFIIGLWTQVTELLDLHPSHDRHIERTVTIVLFFATLVPVSVKLGSKASNVLGALAFDAFPVMLAIVFLLLAWSSHRLLSWRDEAMHPLDKELVTSQRNCDVLLAIMFLASLPIPPTAQILPGISWSGLAWISTFFVAPAIIKRLHRVSTRPLVPSVHV